MTARALAATALAVAAVSLVINGLLLVRLQDAERRIAPYRELLEGMLGETGTVTSEVAIPAGTPIALDVPIDERVSLRVDTTIPINTTVRVPLRSPLGDYTVPVPIRANLPVRATIPVRLQHTFRLRTATASEIVVPLEFRP